MWNNAALLNRMSFALTALAILALLCALAWRAAHFDVFAVRQLDVVGSATHVTRVQVETIVFDELEGTFFTVDLSGARAAFEKLPWVRAVQVRRRWPNRLEVSIEEHREFARWGDSALVNQFGEIFEGASNNQLPMFRGPKGSSVEVTGNYLAFNDALSHIGRRVKLVYLSERRAWRVQLDDGSEIELGREGIIARLNNYVAVYSRSVARLEGEVRYVDLRYANGFTVRLKDLHWSDAQA